MTSANERSRANGSDDENVDVNQLFDVVPIVEEMRGENDSSEDFKGHHKYTLYKYTREDVSTKNLYGDFQTIDWLKDLSTDRERHKKLKERRSLFGKLVSTIDASSGWVLVFLVGLCAGAVAGLVDIGTHWISNLKEGVCVNAFWLNREHCCWSSVNLTFDRVKVENCPEWFSWPEVFGYYGKGSISYVISYAMYILLSLFYSFVVVMLVRVFAPYACGSGIPEIKTILSGFIMRGFLGKWTLLIKSIGMMLATSTSLVVGKEGPFVHIGCCCGNIISYLFPKYGGNEAKKREILSAGAAVGVAVAFGAPLGGVLFSLEEVSYYFPFKTLWRSFFCAMIGALVVRYINPSGNANDIQFAIDYSVPWYYFELIAFAILGTLGGLWGAFYIKFNSSWCKFRNNSRLGQFVITEVLGLTFLTSLFFFPNPYTRMPMSRLIHMMVGQCTVEDSIDLCDYTWKYPIDTAQAKMIPVEAKDGVYTAVWQLTLSAILIMIFMIFTIGAKIPAGLMIPSLCIGAVFGRIFGIFIEYFVLHYPNFFLFKYECGTLDQSCVTPGLYALIGACAFLAGVTKMTVSLVVIMFEITGGLRYIVPLMIATMAAKWTADAFGKGGIYDFDIERQGYPFLDNKEEINISTFAADVMRPRVNDPPLVVLPKDGLSVHELFEILRNKSHSVFPIVSSMETQYLYGQVMRKDILNALSRVKKDMFLDMQRACVQFGPEVRSSSQSQAFDAINFHKIVDLSPITITNQMPMETLIDMFKKMGLRQAYVLHEGYFSMNVFLSCYHLNFNVLSQYVVVS